MLFLLPAHACVCRGIPFLNYPINKIKIGKNLDYEIKMEDKKMNETSNQSLVFADDEGIIKDWNYATTTGKLKSSHKLVVTNKRIVATDSYFYKNGEKTIRQEMRKKDASSVNCYHCNQNYKIAAIVLFVLAALCVVGGIIISTSNSPKETGVGSQVSIILIIVGIYLAIIGLILFFKRKNALVLVITSNSRNNTVFGIYANMGVSLKSKKSGKIKVKVDESVAKDVISSIGALLLTEGN